MVRAACVALALALATPAVAGDWGKDDGGSGWGKAGGSEVAAGKRLSVGAPVVVGDLALYPVIDRDATGRAEVDAVPLAEAMATGRVTVHETGRGTVSELVLANLSEDPVLVMAGDVVQGGMQDRVVRTDALVAGGARVRIPVQCVERGRWTDPHGGVFAYAGRVDPVLRDIVTTAASQDATWAAVAAANRARGVDGAASWLAGRSLDGASLATAERALRERFEDDKRVVGVVVARGGRFTTTEVYPDPSLFARDRLQVLGAQLAAPATAVASHVPTTSDAAAFLVAELGD